MKYFSKKLCSLFAAAACLFSGLSVLTSAENAKAADNAVPAVGTEKQESAFNTDEQLIGHGEKFNFEITVPKDGSYEIVLSYLCRGSQNIELALTVDGKSPFDGAENLVFPCFWVNENEDWRKSTGSQFAPEQTVYDGAVSCAAYDYSGKQEQPYSFKLNAGAHTVDIFVNAGKFVLEGIELVPVRNTAAYDKYGKPSATQAEPIIIEGENCNLKNSRSLIPLSDAASPLVHPSDPLNAKLNYIGGSNWSSPGQTAYWDIEVAVSGYYEVGFLYRQSYNVGAVSYRNLKIDGASPFKEAENIKFSYGSSWRYSVFSNEKNIPYYIYLEKGKHTLSLSVTPGELADYYAAMQAVTTAMGDMYVDITKVVGETVDIYRSYELFNSIPNFNDDLDRIIKMLKTLSKYMLRLQGNKTGSSVSTINDAARVLEQMRNNPYSAHKYKSQFYNSYTNLSAVMAELINMPLDIDRIVLTGYESESRYNSHDVSLGKKISFAFNKFSATFVKEYKSISGDNENKDALTIWINWGRDQAEALNSIIQGDFVEKEKIPVNVSLVNASLVNAVLSGKGPDCMLQMTRTEPVNLAMRGILVDLKQFDDFDAACKRFCDDAVLPYSYRGGVYALPVTQGFNMMFMRTDILDNLGIKTPETWEDFINAAGVLQRNNLQAVIPYTQLSDSGTVNAGVGGLSLYPTLLLQRGLSLYNAEKNGTTFAETEQLQAFIDFTELYTKYKLPIITNFYNRFRLGSAPLGIAPYSLYTQLKAAAPEIDGRWTVSMIPGTVQSDGTVNHCSAAWGAGCAITKLSKNPENAWRFLKWWTSAETQLKYSGVLESVLGPLGRVSTANLEAFSKMDWDMKMYDQMVEQQKNTAEIEEIPGGYYTARGIDQAFWNVNEAGKDPTESFKKWGKVVDNEIKRKKAEYEQ